MEKITITFLGTSQAIPTETRNHTAIHLNYKGENILVDCGEGTQRQFRKAKINPCKLTKLLITHWHGDHVLGIPGLFQTLALNNYSKTLQVFGPKGTKRFMDELLRIFIPVDRIKVEVNEIVGKFFENEDFTLDAVPLEHTVPVNGYAFKEKDRLKIKKELLTKIIKKIKPTKSDFEKIEQLKRGKDITIQKQVLKASQLTYKEKGRKISFIFDTGYCTNAISLANNADLAIVESTYSQEEEELAKEYKHLSAGQAALIAKKAKAQKLILTHLSQRHEFREKMLLQQAKKVFTRTTIAEDLMQIQL
ncbi:MAG: hypothetical protein RL557_798 [archaeon]|jgi:ribonuclease Z